MSRVMLFIGHYPPARRMGGPGRSVSSMIELLTEHEFHVVTSDTEFKSKNVLDGIAVDRWQKRGRARVFYASGANRRLRSLRRLVREVAPDVIYLNGFFARRFTIPILFLRSLRLLGSVPIVLAPRGEFARDALGLKGRRKRLYLNLARSLGLYDGVVWHACSATDVDAIRRVQGSDARIVEAANVPAVARPESLTGHERKRVPGCRLVFLGRIAAMKNLLGALEALARVRAPVTFDIFGPIEDGAYWSRCESLIETMPANVTVSYGGEVDPDDVETVLGRYDALFLPTLGENYGHVVVQAWAAATPVLLSDRTPWTGLEDDRAGWITAPNDAEGFASRIEDLARMPEDEHERWRTGAFHRAERLTENGTLVASYARLFDTARGGGARDMNGDSSALTVIVLTRNEAIHLRRLVESFAGLACRIVVVDCGSDDGTCELARSLGAEVVTHPFESHAAQFNWALDHLAITTPWIMRIDADEYLTPGLAEELGRVLDDAPATTGGFMVRRRVIFWGRWIRHGGYYPLWLLRVWRTGAARVEERLMDEHVVLSKGEFGRLQHDIVDDNLKGLAAWTDKHNRYADNEVLDILRGTTGFDHPGSRGAQASRRRRLKISFYSRAPLFLRSFVYWALRYVVLLGVLDGLPGLVFHFLQGFWYRFLVDAKLYEHRLRQARSGTGGTPRRTP